MQTSLQDSGEYHYVYIPIGYRTMERLAGNTGKDLSKFHTYPGLTSYWNAKEGKQGRYL
jgi:hypothetical protein